MQTVQCFRRLEFSIQGFGFVDSIRVSKNDGIQIADFIVLFNAHEESMGDCLTINGLIFYCSMNVSYGGLYKGKPGPLR